MKNTRVIMMCLTIVAALVVICSCTKEKKENGEAGRELDAATKSLLFQAYVNDDTGLNEGNDIMLPQNDESDKMYGVSEADEYEDDAVDDINELPSSESMELEYVEANGKAKTSTKVGDVKIKGSKKTKDAEGEPRESEEMEENKYSSYMPKFTNRIIRTQYNSYGQTVEIGTNKDFDTYVERVKDKGFIFETETQIGMYYAKTKDGMMLKIQVVSEKLMLISVYDNDLHFGA